MLWVRIPLVDPERRVKAGGIIPPGARVVVIHRGRGFRVRSHRVAPGGSGLFSP